MKSIKKITNLILTKRLNKAEKIGLILLFLFFGIIGYYFFLKEINQTKKQQVIVETCVPVTVEPSEKKASKQPTGEKTSLKQTDVVIARDPFLASSKSEDLTHPITKNIIDLKVSGILWDDQVPTAIIGSKVVRIGDMIAGKIVVDIEMNRIILMEEGEIFVLELNHK